MNPYGIKRYGYLNFEILINLCLITESSSNIMPQLISFEKKVPELLSTIYLKHNYIPDIRYTTRV